MLVGFNYPWPANRYITIGPNLAPRGQPQQWTQDGSIERNFKLLMQHGITVTRIWLLGDGTNYDGSIESGFANDRGLYWDFHPPARLHQSFLDDFDTLLTLCERTGMKIMPVLVDFKFFDEPQKGSRYVQSASSSRTNGDFSQGRRAIASNPALRRTFIDGTLRPLLAKAVERKNTIYAFDVMNEPFWCTAWITGSLFGKRLNPADLNAFLSECVQAVKDAKLPSTIGHRFLGDITGQFASIRVDLPQHHYYAHYVASPDYLMGKTDSPKPAKILGEFASITRREFEELERKARNERDPLRKAILQREVDDFKIQTDNWPQLHDGLQADPRSILEARLRKAEEVGYELAMIWPDAVGEPSRMTYDDLKLKPEKLLSVSRYTGKAPVK